MGARRITHAEEGAAVKRNESGRVVHLGKYNSAADAALAYARSLSRDELAAVMRKEAERVRPPMTFEEAQGLAHSEGLGELRINPKDPTRFLGVRETRRGKGSVTRPFEAHLHITREGQAQRYEYLYLGSFASAPEAALAIARKTASLRK